jgi:hypothetical protein
MFAGAGLALAEPPPATIPAPLTAGNACPCDPAQAPLIADGNECTPRFRVDGEYLLWWFKSSPVPVPLITDGPVGVPVTVGPLATQTFLGDSNLGSPMHQGARFTAEGWLDDARTIGVGASFLFLAKESATHALAGAGGATEATFGIPFFNATPGINVEDFVALNTPGLSAGAASVTATSSLWGTEANAFVNVVRQGRASLDLLGGFRFLQLNEGLSFNAATTGVGPAAGLLFTSADDFSTHNNFYGGQLGARGAIGFGRFSIDGAVKVALGSVEEVSNVSGGNASNVAAGPGTAPVLGPGGFFALATNSGHFSRSEFAVLPEVSLNLDYQLTDRTRAFVGYSFLYLSDVVRPGDQIDRVINTTQAPAFGGSAATLTGPPLPASQLRGSDFWAHGLNFGVEFRF